MNTLRRIFGRKAPAQPSPIVQATVNRGCSFESCPAPWEGQEWHGWRLCPEHMAQVAVVAGARTPSFV